MARLSLRSTAGVLSFMLSGVLLASVLPPDDKTFRCHTEEMYDQMNEATSATNGAVFGIAAVVAAFSLYGLLPRRRAEREVALAEQDEDEATRIDNNNRNKIYAAVVAGILFAVGLIFSGMVIYSKLFGFLDVTLIPRGAWDPTLILVMGGGVAVSFASYQFVDGFNIIKVRGCLTIWLSGKDPFTTRL